MFEHLTTIWNSLVIAIIGATSDHHPAVETISLDRPRDNWAVISEVSGAVRYKRIHSAAWYDGRVGIGLRPGDKIYVATGGSILLRYPHLQASIFCSTPSLFIVEADLDHLRFFQRSFGLYGVKKGSASNEKNTTKGTIDELNTDLQRFSSFLERPGDRSAITEVPTTQNQNSGKLEDLSFSLEDDKQSGNSRTLKFQNDSFAFVRKVALIRWIFPKGNMELVSKSYPRTLVFEANNPDQRKLLYAFLWHDRAVKPIWSGASLGRWQATIPGPGRYRIQALSEDNSAISDVLWITANTSQTGDLIPEFWDNGTTRWINE